MEDQGVGSLGFVTSVTGSRAMITLHARPADHPHDESRVTIGKLVAVVTSVSWVIGVIARLAASTTDGEGHPAGDLCADVDFLGEVVGHGTPEARFQRGVSDYPVVGDRVVALRGGDISLIHRISEGGTINVGRLQMDATVPALVDFDELLGKHFAILGTTGVGKSSAVALILREILRQKSNLRIFLIDPHNEYGHCFGDMARVISPKNLKLPFWLFNFEEIVDVFFRARPGVEEETEILSELIPLAKARYAAAARGERVLLRRAAGAGYTADTPVPYRVSDLVDLINERMGKLENRSSWMKYHRLITRIETLGQDSRYGFMFDNLLVDDVMGKVLGDLFRLPVDGKPITVMQLAGFPAEVVDSVVSVVCRLAFELGIWSDGSVPVLVACEEAHRYAPADRKLGFGPTRKALSRIAKEGRKYSVYLGAVTQRPADLDANILSQCSTVFAMRLANERDQEIVRSAVPDAAASLLGFLASLGVREAIAFGEGVPLPTRLRFGDLAEEFLPYSQSDGRRFKATDRVDADFVDSVVDRWREASTTTPRGRGAALAEAQETDRGLGSLEAFTASKPR